MNYVFKGVTINKPNDAEWSIVAEQVNLRRTKESLKSEFKSYKQKRKQMIKRQINMLKLDLQSKQNDLRGLKEEIIEAKANFKAQVNEASLLAKNKRTDVFFNEKSNEISLWKKDALELLVHKFGPNCKDPAYAIAVAKVEAKAAAELAQVKKYTSDPAVVNDELKSQIAKYRKELDEVIQAAEKKKALAREELNVAKKNTREAIMAYRVKIKQDLISRRSGLSKSKRGARHIAATAKKRIVDSRVFLNSYYEPILDEQVKNKEQTSFKRLPVLLKEFSLRFKVSSLEWRLFSKDEIALQKKKIELLNSLSRHHDFLNDMSFDWKARKIEFALRAEYQARILSLLQERKTIFAKDEQSYQQISAGYDKKEEAQKRKAAIKLLVDDFKQKRTTIIETYKSGSVSKQTKRTSLRANRIDFKNSKRSLRIEDPLASAREKKRFHLLETKFLIKKENELMNSLIDDALKTIPTKAIKHQRWLSAVLSFLIPGVGQMVNKQYAKGMLLLLLAGFVYGFLLLLAIGTISFSHGGVAGLGDLSPVESSFNNYVTYEDARFRLIEGLIGVMAIAIGLLALIMSARDAWWFGKAKELGIRPGNWRALKKYFANAGLPYIMSVPALVGVLFTVILPLAATLLLAFTNYSSGHIPPGNPLSWVGFDNFKEVFSGAYAASFGYVATWTVIWTVVVSAGVIGVGTLLAFLGDQKRMKVKILWKTVFILPWAIPAFATILFFSTAFGGSGNGIYNQLFGLSTDFKQDATATRAILVIIQIWLGHSYIFLLITGVKKSIPSDLYEAAAIDGASKSRQFSMISAPLIMAQIAPLLIGQIVFNFNNYGVIFLFNDGGPLPAETYAGGPGSTDIFLSLIFKMTTSGSNNQVALASAFTIVISFFIVMVSAVGFVRSKAFKGVV